MTPPQLTAMQGLLLRHDTGWRWRDGQAEPRVRDLTAAEAFQFPVTVSPHPTLPGASERWVRLPDAVVEDEPDLTEFVASLGLAARPAPFDPSYTEVPAEAWERFGPTVLGVVWDPADEVDLLARADALRAGRVL